MFKRIIRWRALGLLSRYTITTTIVDVFFQRVLGISGRCKYLLHFTSKATAADGVELYGEGVLTERCLSLNGGILLQGSNGIRIHREVLIAPGVKIISGNHNFDNFHDASIEAEPIHIMKDCWIGANAVVLPGVVLFPGTIVGAGSVVLRSFNKENIVVAGNPARIIRERIVEDK